MVKLLTHICVPRTRWVNTGIYINRQFNRIVWIAIWYLQNMILCKNMLTCENLQGIMKTSYVENNEITSVNNMYWLLETVTRRKLNISKKIGCKCICWSRFWNISWCCHDMQILSTAISSRTTSYQWIPLTKGQYCGILMFSLLYALTSCWTNGDCTYHATDVP